MSLFLRTAKLNVTGFDVSRLRFGFNIDKHLRKEPNTSKITVYNLSADYRKALESIDGDIPVRLEAGYKDLTFVLFNGTLDSAVSERDGATWLTTLYADDGKKAVKARGSRTFRAGVSVKKVIEDLSKELNVGLGNIFEEITGGFSLDRIGKALSSGFASKGSKQDALERLLNAGGLTYSVQNGEIEVRKVGTPVVDTNSAVILSPSTGLVDSPNVDKDGRIEARSLLIDGLSPGYPVKIKTESIDGLWLVDSVSYSGDTHGSDWYADIEGAPLT